MRLADAKANAPAADDLDDALATLLEDGAEIVVGFVDESRHQMYRRLTWVVRMRVCEGEHAGRLISWWMRVLDRERRVARGSAIAASYVAATGLRPPRDLPRRRPSYWLRDAQFLVRTRVVRKDVHGVERAPSACYSVIAAILQRVAGSPPALRERTNEQR